MSNKIEGIPDGWELVGVRKCKFGEFYVAHNGKPCMWTYSDSSGYSNYVIIRKLEKPKEYRPFKNAAEAEMFFDRKLKYKQHDESVLRICFLSNKGVHVSKYDYTYEEAFDVLECMDGTPFGVEVTE